MGEILLKGGTVIDGTGAPRQEADVLISDDKIKSIGKGLGTTGKVIDVTGLTVTPGIIDPHTHLDGQFFFEPTGSSSCWHGVTTVMMGHCGYSLAPISLEHRDYIIHMFARVEEVSPQLFEEQIPWNWVTFPEYMDRLESNGLGINAIPQVGHSTLRYHVMGPEAIQREATEDEVTRMRQIFHNAVEAGAFGFTTARAGPHVDWDGTPVPSRWAATSEILKLAQELQRMKVGTLELNPAGVLQGITPEDKDLIIDMARESGGKTVQIPGGARSAEARQFMIDIGKQGVNLYTVTSPQAFFRVFTFAEGTVLLNSMDTWMDIMNAPTQDRLRRLESPDIRQKLREEIDAEPLMETTGMRQPKINWQETRVIKAAKPENRVFEGKSLLELAADQSKHLVDAMLDLAASEDWKTQFDKPLRGGLGVVHQRPRRPAQAPEPLPDEHGQRGPPGQLLKDGGRHLFPSPMGNGPGHHEHRGRVPDADFRCRPVDWPPGPWRSEGRHGCRRRRVRSGRAALPTQ